MKYIKRLNEINFVEAIKNMGTKKTEPYQSSSPEKKRRKIFPSSKDHLKTSDSKLEASQFQAASSMKNTAYFKVADQEQLQPQVNIEEAEIFIRNLSEAARQDRKKEQIKLKPRELNELEIEPLYMQDSEERIISFELQLGESSQDIEDRIDFLSKQLYGVDNAQQAIMTQESGSLLEVFSVLQNQILESGLALEQISALRMKIATLQRISASKQIVRKSQKLAILRGKLLILKRVKENKLVTPRNIGEIFYTERSRSKMYSKIAGSPLRHANYFQTVLAKLAQIAQLNIAIIEKSIASWIKLELNDKQIEKLVILLYFISSDKMYRQFGLSIDYNKYDPTELKERWASAPQQFHYLKGKEQEVLAFIRSSMNL